MRPKPEIELSIICRGGRFATRGLVEALQQVLAIIGVRTGVWNIVLVADAEMKELHERHLGITTTTDVLTFDMREKGQKALELESVICVDEAGRRAGEMGHHIGGELLLYAVHSLLHVMGYDDGTTEGARQMHAREDEILSAVGAGTVFAGKQKPPLGKRKAIRTLRKTIHRARRAVSGVGR